ncbi:MAG: hypothetical protein WCO10_03435 [bacterium]
MSEGIPDPDHTGFISKEDFDKMLEEGRRLAKEQAALKKDAPKVVGQGHDTGGFGAPVGVDETLTSMLTPEEQEEFRRRLSEQDAGWDNK